MTSTASTTPVASMASSALFHQKIAELDVFINPDSKMTYSGFLMFDGALKIQFLHNFLAPFLLEAVEEKEVTFNQIKGS